MKFEKVWCLFEQSGTFKNVMKNMGYQSYDVDILNDFNQTDYEIDIFKEINLCYEGNESFFDSISSNDLIFSFFPCTRFESHAPLNSRGEHKSMKLWDDLKKINYSMNLNNEINYFYTTLCKLFIICYRKNFRMILENPYTQPHYLTTFFPIKPTFVDYDRTQNGDNYKKPTQFWFVNCEPEQNILFEPLHYVEYKRISKEGNRVTRSLINPQYVERFIKQFVL